MSGARGSLLGIEHLEAAEILKILKFARRMNPDKPRPKEAAHREPETAGDYRLKFGHAH